MKLPKPLKTGLLVIVGSFALLWFIMLLWYLSLRSFPLSYWAKIRIVTLKHNVVFNTVYKSIFANPLSTVFPSKEFSLYMPKHNKPLLMLEKNLGGVYEYEGYGKVIDIEKEARDLILVTVKFESGKIEDYSFNYNSRYFDSAYPGKIDFYRLERKDLFSEDLNEIAGSWVRIRWWSDEPIETYLDSSGQTSEKELVDAIQKMPDWLRYE